MVERVYVDRVVTAKCVTAQRPAMHAVPAPIVCEKDKPCPSGCPVGMTCWSILVSNDLADNVEKLMDRIDADIQTCGTDEVKTNPGNWVR